MGDSLAQGYGLPADQGFVPMLLHSSPPLDRRILAFSGLFITTDRLRRRDNAKLSERYIRSRLMGSILVGVPTPNLQLFPRIGKVHDPVARSRHSGQSLLLNVRMDPHTIRGNACPDPR